MVLASAPARGQGSGWITYERCPVMVEHSVDVPARERGFLKTLSVEVNQSVELGATLGELETDEAELALAIARMEHEQAVEVAADDSNLTFHEIALEVAREELASYRSIQSSVSESEIRRRKLATDQADLALVRAKQLKRANEMQARLKRATVKLAELRLERHRIIAPLSGIVTAIEAHPGQALDSGETLLRIRNMENLLVDRLIPVDQVHVAGLVGSDVRVDALILGRSHRLAGKVISADPEVSSQGLTRIHARVKNIQRDGDWVLKPGSEVTMYIASPTAATASRIGGGAAIK